MSRLGDAGLLLRWPPAIELATCAEVQRLCARLAEHRPPWLIDLVPAYASLALLVDPDAGDDPLAAAETWLQAQLDQHLQASVDDGREAPGRLVRIPVCYDAECGPDLAVLAEATGLAIPALVARHCAPEYRVAMLGFAPGFPYLLGLDPALATPRLATPRARVAAGSVGIGGAQTGIYPREGPGGWRLLGRTPLRLFDPLREPASLLAPGDRVRFEAISRRRFEALSQ